MKRFSGGLVASGLLLAATTATAQSAIRPGDTLRGTLSSSDAVLDDGSFYDCFTLQARRGERLEVTLRSSDFDAYLAVLEGGSCAAGASGESDDDSAGGADSLVRITLGGGPYSIRANSLNEGETGAYTLSVARVAASPVAQPRYLGRESTEVTGELAAGDMIAGDNSLYDCYAFDVRSGQTAAIVLNSDDFDAYLSLHEGAGCDTEIASDDDGMGGTNAYIEHRFDRGGRYSIRANSLESGETGRYGLVLLIE